MKILNAKELAEVDAFTMNSQSLTDWELMERASSRAFLEILKKINPEKDFVYIFCGTSNNGGDGLALARMLNQKQVKIRVFEVAYSSSTSKAYQKNIKFLKENRIQINTVQNQNEIPDLNPATCIIDAIFGVGLNRRMPGFIQELVKKINLTEAFKISIDVPSGMYLEQSIETDEEFVISDLCLTFQLPKLPFLLPETGHYVENFKLIDIGLSEEKIKQTKTPYNYITTSDVSSILKKRAKFSHKGRFGNALLIGGYEGMWGSVIMTTQACLRSGAGKVYTHLDKAGRLVLAQHALESIYIQNCPKALKSNSNWNAIGVGMGLGLSNNAVQLMEEVLAHQPKRLLLDADAINLLSKQKNWLKLLPKNSVLTPHIGELKRLVGEWDNDFDKLNKAKQFCKTYQVVLIIKGAHTCICDGTNFYFNSSGNPGLAKAGSGDVLAGVITALLAQNYKVLEACQLGVYLHGLAADLALESFSEHSLIATDVISYLGKAFQLLESKID